jgi:hypothetical protein
LKDGGEVHRVECHFKDIATDSAADYNQQMLAGEDAFEGTLEDAIEDARYVMNWTKIFSGMGVALGRAAMASERLSRTPL